MLSLDSATGIEFRGDDLIISSVGRGFREVSIRNEITISGVALLTIAQIVEQIRNAPHSKEINRENVILGLPRDSVVIRTVELPLEVEENLEQVVRFQIERFEPIEGEVSCFDHVVLSRDEKQRRIKLQIIIAPSAALDEQLELLRQIDLYPSAVRVAGHALNHLLRGHEDGFPKEHPAVVLDVRPETVLMTAILGAGRAHSEEIEMSDEDLNFENVLRELHRFLSEQSLDSDKLSKIYFVGGRSASLLPAFQQNFSDCEPLLARSTLKTGVVTTNRLDWAKNAVSLALSGLHNASGFNLIPREQRVLRERPSLLPTIALAALLLIVGGAAIGRDYFQSDRLLQAIERKVDELSPRVNRTLQVRNEIAEKEAQLEELQKVLDDNMVVLRVLKELTETIPDDSYLESLSFQGDRINMTGHSAKASALLTTLLQSSCLESVEQKYIIPGSDNKERFRFEAQVVPCGESAESVPTEIATVSEQ